MNVTTENLIELRRALHRIPELAMQEHATHALLARRVAALPQTFLTVFTPPQFPTALLVHVAGSAPRRTIGYRADMDALPVQEATGLPFASQHPGIAHACGHDLHMTVAMGVLAHFASHQPQDDLVFLFQPAEESQSGAKQLYDAGVLSGRWHLDEIYALHDRPDLPCGAIGSTVGTLFAGTTEVNVTIHGQGGHAAFPQAANDAIVAACAYVMQAQTIVARNIAPTESAVITFGKITGGTIRNVIADTVRLEGTLRGFTQRTIAFLQQRLRQLGAGIAASFNCRVDVDLQQGGYFPVENDPALTRAFIAYMRQAAGVKFLTTPGVMTGEDFGYLLHHIPGTMFWLGVDDTHALHTAGFNPNEAALAPGVHAVVGWLNARMAQA